MMKRMPRGALVGYPLQAAAAAQSHRVQVGYCSNLKSVDSAKAAGFEYLELGTSEIAALTDDAFEDTVKRLKALGLPIPVTNLFVPATIKLTGPDTNAEQQI